MNHAEGHQAIEARASKQDLPFFGGADFLAASGGLAVSFFGASSKLHFSSRYPTFCFRWLRLSLSGAYGGTWRRPSQAPFAAEP
jgi:hypothetical protein